MASNFMKQFNDLISGRLHKRIKSQGEQLDEMTATIKDLKKRAAKRRMKKLRAAYDKHRR